MSDSQSPRQSSVKSATKPPLPSVAAARRGIARHVVRGAVDAYNEALRAQAEARNTFGLEDEACDAMVEVVRGRVQDAERTLVRAILNLTPDGQPAYVPEAEMWLLPPAGVSLDGRLYLVAPISGRFDFIEPGKKSTDDDRDALPVMGLAVLDQSAVVDMDDTPIHELAPTD